jgi:hypothetical protein
MRRTAVAAGSIVAALAVGGVVAVSGGAQPPGGHTISLVTKDYVAKTIDLPPRNRGFSFGSGDRFVSSATVVNAAGAPRGSFDADCVVTRGSAAHTRFFCDGVYVLAEGQIFVQMRFSDFSLSKGPSAEGAVVGGTRGYAGARGTFTTNDRPDANDDSADDVITLLP